VSQQRPRPRYSAMRGLKASFVAASALATLLVGVIAPATLAGTTTLTGTPNLPIVDDAYAGGTVGMTVSSVNVTLPFILDATNVRVKVGIDHTAVGDLTIKLTSPTGTVFTVLERPQGDDTSNNAGDSGADAPVGDTSDLDWEYGLTFSDVNNVDPEGMGVGLGDAGVVCQDDAACNFASNPDAAVTTGSGPDFTAFDGDMARGNWTLGVGDSKPGDSGTFVYWTLTFDWVVSALIDVQGPDNVALIDDGYGTFGGSESIIDTSDEIPFNRLITDVSVTITMTHTWVGDLNIALISPEGGRLVLVDRPQGDDTANNTGDNGADLPAGDNSNLETSWPISFNDTFANDPEDMGKDIGDAQAVCGHDSRCEFFPNPDQGTYGNISNFAGFDGQRANGLWTLVINDGRPTDTGELDNWTLTVRHTLEQVPCSTPDTTAPFSDVPLNHPFCTAIKWMKDTAISTGFDDGTYRPAIAVTRQAMSAFMARLYGAFPTECKTQPFTDVSTTHPFCQEIKWMKDSGISTGFGDGTYKPSLPVTRAAMSAFMARLARVANSLPACVSAPFPDVAVSHPFCKEIKWMKDSGVSTGFNDGTYRPSIAVTRQAMSAFMLRVVMLLH
jgi:subtilisin-like proprotein convertase family protein